MMDLTLRGSELGMHRKGDLENLSFFFLFRSSEIL